MKFAQKTINDLRSSANLLMEEAKICVNAANYCDAEAQRIAGHLIAERKMLRKEAKEYERSAQEFREVANRLDKLYE